MEAVILRDLHIDSTTTGSVATQDVGRAIVEAIRLLRSQSFGWNQADYTISLQESTQRYSLPNDFMGLTGDVFFNSGSDIPGTALRALQWAPLNQIKEYRFTTTSLSELINTGAPMYYGIDPKNDEIVFAPVPSSDDDTVEFEYIRDAGTPWYQDVSGTITFYKPGSEDAITSGYTSDWFNLDKGFDLVRYKASELLWTGPYGGTERAAEKAVESMQRFAQTLNNMRSDVGKKVGARNFRRWM